MGVWKSKATGRWIAQFRHNGTRHKKEGFQSRNDAIQWEAAQRVSQKIPGAPIPTISFLKISTDYIRDCENKYRHNTTRYKKAAIRSFLSFMKGDIPFENVTPTMIKDYLSAKVKAASDQKSTENKQKEPDRSANKSANRDLRELKALYNWAIDSHLYKYVNPCKYVKKYPENEYVPYCPKFNEFEKVMAVANEEERDFLIFIFNTLARTIEASHRLEWTHIDFERKTVRLFCMKRKDGNLQYDDIPMTKVLFEMLKKRSEGLKSENSRVFEFTDYQVRMMMPRLCKKCGVKKFGLKAIRHMVASIMGDSGKVSIKQIQFLMRHKRQATTENYVHILDKHLTMAIGSLEGMNQKVARNGTPDVGQLGGCDPL